MKRTTLAGLALIVVGALNIAMANVTMNNYPVFSNVQNIVGLIGIGFGIVLVSIGMLWLNNFKGMEGK